MILARNASAGIPAQSLGLAATGLCWTLCSKSGPGLLRSSPRSIWRSVRTIPLLAQSTSPRRCCWPGRCADVFAALLLAAGLHTLCWDAPVDDEGVITQNTTIIRNGMLESYLHNRESAAKYGVDPTGSARAWEYSDQPLIRMRNTYLAPGETTLEEMIASTKDGYLLDGPRNGQADATGEFMFGVQEARRIRDGKLCELVRGVTISGIAFDVMQTVDAVSNEFKWDLGSGYCGKGQPAKVDAGGPYIRCQAILGGEQ